MQNVCMEDKKEMLLTQTSQLVKTQQNRQFRIKTKKAQTLEKVL